MDMSDHQNHIGTILGQLVKKWELVNPEAIRALERFNRENNNVLLANPEEKLRMLQEIELKAFTGTATGQRIDLSVYKKCLGRLNEDASKQKQPLLKKGVS